MTQQLFASLAFLIAIIGLAMVARVYMRKDLDEEDVEPAAFYEQVRPLTEPEQILYWRLTKALPECVVLSQVTFSRFMKPVTDGKLPLSQYRGLQNRVAQKTIDFLVCLADFTVVAAVELDDRSHIRARDEKRDELLRAAGIQVIRLRVSDIPSVEELRARFTEDGERKPALVQ